MYIYSGYENLGQITDITDVITGPIITTGGPLRVPSVTQKDLIVATTAGRTTADADTRRKVAKVLGIPSNSTGEAIKKAYADAQTRCRADDMLKVMTFFTDPCPGWVLSGRYASNQKTAISTAQERKILEATIPLDINPNQFRIRQENCRKSLVSGRTYKIDPCRADSIIKQIRIENQKKTISVEQPAQVTTSDKRIILIAIVLLTLPLYLLILTK